jgi:hypothetical protein
MTTEPRQPAHQPASLPIALALVDGEHPRSRYGLDLQGIEPPLPFLHAVTSRV